jgi:uncharacterized protein (DUF305 family)
LLGALAASPASAQQTQHHGGGDGGGAMGMHGGAIQSAMERMQQGMAAPMSGNPDVDFATMMIPHHEGAIEMADAALARSSNSVVVPFAQSIVESQGGEIVLMEEMLRTRG